MARHAAPRRIVVLAPAFHGYGHTFTTSLAASGHSVDLIEYDVRSLARRVELKLTVEVPQRLGLPHRAVQCKALLVGRVLERLRALRPDLVLGIKADIFGPEFWCDVHALGARSQLYLFDEVRRMAHDPATFSVVDHLATYSALDAQQLRSSGLEVTHVPNAFDHRAPIGPKRATNLLFVGARYPNREELITSLVGAGLPVLAVGRDWSQHPWDRLRTLSWGRPEVQASRDVSREVAYGLMQGAKANLNMHFDQDGFTMRTFEIPGVGGVQLIDRADIGEFYEPDREVLVYTSVEEAIDQARRALGDPALRQGMAERAQARTLAEHTFDQRIKLFEAQWG